MTFINETARCYVIGDIHGRLDLLDQMIGKIESHAKERGGDCLTVTLGDYIDRGPNSRGVIDRLLSNPFPGSYIPLKGNHEDLLETFLADPASGSYWSHLGGLETLRSFGIPVRRGMVEKDYSQAALQLQESLSPEQKKFLASLKLSLPLGLYFLCHAGVRPGIPLSQQRGDDLLWIRDEFLSSQADFGKVVVHGHTPVVKPESLPNRINIDTGAFATGRLTCVVLDGDQRQFLST